MSGTAKLVIGIVVGLFFIGILTIIGFSTQKKTDTSSSTAQTSSSSQSTDTTQDTDVAATIIYTNEGFQPNFYIIDANNYIRVRNNSTHPLQFMSDPVEKNSDEPEFNLGDIKPGGNAKVYITQKGTWGFHNALNANDIGQIIVR
jgi:hypothetical protein